MRDLDQALPGISFFRSSSKFQPIWLEYGTFEHGDIWSSMAVYLLAENATLQNAFNLISKYHD